MCDFLSIGHFCSNDPDLWPPFQTILILTFYFILTLGIFTIEDILNLKKNNNNWDGKVCNCVCVQCHHTTRSSSTWLASTVGHRSSTISRLECRPRAIHNRRCRCHNSSLITWTPVTRWVCIQATSSSSSSHCLTSTEVIHSHRLRNNRWGWWRQDSQVECRCSPEGLRWWGRPLPVRWQGCQCSREAVNTCPPGVQWCRLELADKEVRWDRRRLGPWATRCHHLVKCRRGSTRTTRSKGSSEYQVSFPITRIVPNRHQRFPRAGFTLRDVSCARQRQNARMVPQRSALRSATRDLICRTAGEFDITAAGIVKITSVCITIIIIIILLLWSKLFSSRTALTAGDQIGTAFIVSLFCCTALVCAMCVYVGLWVRKFPPENFRKFIPFFPEIYSILSRNLYFRKISANFY